MFSSIILLAAAIVKPTFAAYDLTDSYDISSFFDRFTFYIDGDPTDGYVTYVDEDTASAGGLINTNNNQAYIGVDYTNIASGSGRESVRLTSNSVYNEGLFILDLAHMPGSVCGTWPAFWMFGPNWPDSGEIDIIEGVNVNTNNAMTLHTSEGCEVVNNGDFTGTLTTTDCWIDDPNQSSNAGCDIQDSSSDSYGTNFNNNGGGVFATLWTTSVIQIWFFDRSSIPPDISSDPDPTSWGAPSASFEGCDIETYFANQNIIFDDTFCGDWAGAVWSSTASCAALDSSCTDYVQNNPSAFEESYWLVNSLNVFTSDGTDGPAAVNVTATESTETFVKSAPLAMGGGTTSKRKRPAS